MNSCKRGSVYGFKIQSLDMVRSLYMLYIVIIIIHGVVGGPYYHSAVVCYFRLL